MPRPISKVAPEWWDYTTLDAEILDDAARLTAEDLAQLSRPGFQVVMYDTLEDFYLAEALEYIDGLAAVDRRQPGGHLRPDRPDRAVAAGGPAGQRPGIWTSATPISGAWTSGSTTTAVPVPITHPLSFAKADMEMCFNRIEPQAAHARRAPALPHRRSGRLLARPTTRSAAR